MGFLTNTMTSPPEQRAAINLTNWTTALWGQPAKAGVTVNRENSLQVMAVLACVRVISEGVGQMPLRVFRTADGKSKIEERTAPISTLIAKRPNAWQTALEWREIVTAHAVLTGNGYSYKNIVNGRLVELIPIVPSSVRVIQNKSFELDYKLMVGGSWVDVPTERMFHIRGPGWNGYTGWDVVSMARDAIGLSIATEESQSKLHANGGKPGGILSTDNQLSEEAIGNLKESWLGSVGGSNKFGTAVLDNGFKFTPLSFSGVDAQHLETRKHQIEEICRAFNVFPQMVMQSDKSSTYASAEAFFAAHVRHTLGPWLRRWEESIDKDLLDGQGPLFAKFDTRHLTKANAADREKFYRTVAEMGIYTRNEIREMEGLDPLPGLDEPLTPMNMAQGEGDD